MKHETTKCVKKNDRAYPLLLKETAGAPEALYLRGRLPRDDESLIAIVGTRKATHEGIRLAKSIGKTLAEYGFGIISGLALGIDAASHEGALIAGGKTFAVLANGLDTIYPRTNEAIAQKILETSGGIISEYPDGTPPLPHRFLERNRIVGGLSIATVIIEAPIHSGALVTARCAAEDGREVFVLPGPAGHPNYAGSHLLIRNGARLVTGAEDILEDLKNSIQKLPTPLQDTQGSALEPHEAGEEIILRALSSSKEPLTVDRIIELTKLEPHIVHQRLTFLTLENAIKEKNGKFKIRS